MFPCWERKESGIDPTRTGDIGRPALFRFRFPGSESRPGGKNFPGGVQYCTVLNAAQDSNPQTTTASILSSRTAMAL